MFSFNTYLWYNKSKKALSKNGEVSLYLRVYIGSTGLSETKQFPLKLRWPVDRIDLESSRILPRHRKDEDVNDYNIIILNERAKHNEIAKIHRLSGSKLNMTIFVRDLKLFDYRTALITYMDKKRKDLLKAKEIEWGTYKNVGSTIKTITDYQQFVRFDEVNTKWMQKFKAWMLGSGLKHSTVWTKMKDLKRYLNLAREEKLIYVDPDAITFPNPEPVMPTVYLNRNEIKALMHIFDRDLLDETQYNVLRAFLFICFTSLRIGDIYKAGNGMLISPGMLTFVAGKNKNKKPKRINIPLVPLAQNLIDDTLSKFFELPTEQEFNRTLKDLAKMVGINKKLSAHVGRHTFGYLYMTTIGNLYGLKEILGHSKIETTQRYAHLDDEYQMEQAILMQKGFEDVAQYPKLRTIQTI